MRIPFRFARDRAEIENRKDHPVFDPATGQSAAQLDAALAEIASSGRPHGDIKAEMIAYLLDHAPLELSPCDLFADRIDHGGRIQRYRSQWSEAARAASPENWSETDVGAVCGAYSGDEDFSHTCPDWASLLTLGLPGTVQALEDGWRAADDAHRPFFDRALTVWRAMIRLALRFANAADAYAASHPASACMAENFRAIAARAPQTMYEAMQLGLLVYRMQTHVECENVRTFGRLDVLLLRYPTDDTTDELLRYFFTRLNDFQIDPNLPFTICGIGADGDPAAEALVLRMLRIYGELGNYSPKIQVRVSDRTPKSILTAVCRLIRAGSSSFVLCSDRVIVEALVRSGVARADAENYVLIGCYEPGAMGVQTPCTCAGRVSLPKAVETALNGGRDLRTDTLVGLPCADEFADFDAFFAEVVRQGQYFADQSMRRMRAIEACYPEINPSPLYSGGMAVCRADRNPAERPDHRAARRADLRQERCRHADARGRVRPERVPHRVEQPQRRRVRRMHHRCGGAGQAHRQVIHNRAEPHRAGRNGARVRQHAVRHQPVPGGQRRPRDARCPFGVRFAAAVLHPQRVLPCVQVGHRVPRRVHIHDPVHLPAQPDPLRCGVRLHQQLRDRFRALADFRRALDPRCVRNGGVRFDGIAFQHGAVRVQHHRAERGGA